MKYDQIAAIYDVNESSLRRWKRAGALANKPAPLSDPPAMVRWWEEMVAIGEFQKSCPAGIEAAASRLAAALPKDGSGDEPEGTADAELASLLANIKGSGIPDYSDGIRTAQRSVMVADYLLLKALAKNEEKKIGPLQKRLGDAQEVLRGLQRDRGRIEAEAGDTLPKEEVRAAMLELHANITRRFRQGIRAGFHDAAELTASREDWGEFADRLVDVICKALTDSNFAAE